MEAGTTSSRRTITMDSDNAWLRLEDRPSDHSILVGATFSCITWRGRLRALVHPFQSPHSANRHHARCDTIGLNYVDCAMRYRKLRIAFSVACLVACELLAWRFK